MTEDRNEEDRNKKHDQKSDQFGGQAGETNQSKRHDQEHSGQQTDRTDNTAQKRPTQSGHDVETDEQGDQDKAGQRRAS